ncbi:hypothetical protein [Methylobacterium sp. R2-1]|uniref:hypothetical protein n=1 Tax=Methylobacterium sp. R2-1 TaxID=2587064 RepID=UPI001607B66D|nr:hypothetical protein [Methylobacterium sp. R2-1]MBB2964334.1 hypothetical protein [Methylobacterium sp. R2-1]
MPESRIRPTSWHPPSRIRSPQKAVLPLIAVIDREGRVTGVFAGRTAARTFLHGGRA